MRHLTVPTRFGSKLTVVATAATLAVGGAAAAQTGPFSPDEDTHGTVGDAVTEDDQDDGATDDGATDDGTLDDGTLDDGDGSDADGTADGTQPETDDGTTDGDLADDDSDDSDDGEGDGDGDGRDDGEGDGRDDGEDGPAGRHARDGERRGSATSERVHEAQTLDGQLRPGDEGWGAAVSESARSGGHGERVSRAARGLDASPPAVPGADAPASTTRRDPPGRSGGGGGSQAPGQGGSKGRGSR